MDRCWSKNEKLSVIRIIRSEDLMCSMVITLNNIMLYTLLKDTVLRE